MFQFLKDNWEGIVLAILAAETLAVYVTKLTPSTKDDEIVQKVTETLASFGIKPKQ